MIDDGSFPFYQIVGRCFAACSPFVFGGEAMLSAVCFALGANFCWMLDVNVVLGSLLDIRIRYFTLLLWGRFFVGSDNKTNLPALRRGIITSSLCLKFLTWLDGQMFPLKWLEELSKKSIF